MGTEDQDRRFKYGPHIGNFYIWEVFEEKVDRFVAIANTEEDAALITHSLNEMIRQPAPR